MKSVSPLPESGGHPQGGPLSFCPAVRVAVIAALLAACGGQGGPDRPGSRRPGETFARPLEIYREMGLLAGPALFPAVASFSTLAGPADSTYVVLSLSIPNSALRFQRDSAGFYADYNVNITFMDTDSVTVSRVQNRETVRIPTFSETSRTDESIVHQQGVLVEAGRYLVRVEVLDANSSRGFRSTDTLTVPAYGPAARTVSTPLLVYEATGRSSLTHLPGIITNPRHTVPYGNGSPRIYIESYSARTSLPVRVLNRDGDTLWTGQAVFTDRDVVHYAVIDVPPDVLSLGRFVIEVGDDVATASRTTLVMTISDEWMVDNIEDVLRFVRYIATSAELDSLKDGTPAQRRDAWERFWTRRDPLPATTINEYRDEFFQRVRYATEAFRDASGHDGWTTARGEVFIVLGPPTYVRERVFSSESTISGRASIVEWVYDSIAGGRLILVFRDRSGFGRYELEPASAAAFRSVAERLKQRRDAG